MFNPYEEEATRDRKMRIETELRDRFAGLAMQALLTNRSYAEDYVAKSAWAYADAMLRHRND